MFVRSLTDVESTDKFVDWGNGTSHRLITSADSMGFTICHTLVRAGTESKLRYHRHLEACYCIEGEGEVEDMGGSVFHITRGYLYALDRHEPHILRGGSNKNLILLSVFNPPLVGNETHNLDQQSGSGY